MSEVLLYGGTTEGRVLAERLSQAGISVELHVATEYGNYVMPELPGVTVVTGRLGEEEMRALASAGFQAVVDATHPFAREVSQNIKKSLIGSEIPLYCLHREACNDIEGQYSCYEDHGSCAQALARMEGNILLTTGSNHLECYCRQEELRDRLFVRILPGGENLKKCEQLGIRGRQVIAMQGPFSQEMNLALIHQFGIRHMVTKASGAGSGFREKEKAAAEAGILLHVIGRPATEQGVEFSQMAAALSAQFGRPVDGSVHMEISLIGIGMGKDQLTVEAKRALEEARLVFGAPRMLETLAAGKECCPGYLAADILPVLMDRKRHFAGDVLRVAVLFSGDTGFYSGCEKMESELNKNGFSDVTIYPGISSVSCLAARAGVSWQDAALFSIHGRTGTPGWEAQLLSAVQYHEKTFLLVSDGKQLQRVGQILMAAGLGSCRMFCGYDLSYPWERLVSVLASEAEKLPEMGLCTCLLLNDGVREAACVPGIPDDSFIREKVPMTKEEIREVSLCKLGLTERAVVYDVGSGTGSIAVECGRLSSGIRVYAIERKPEALALLKKNLKVFHLQNVFPVEGIAPTALEPLEPPTHVFVGGSSGKLEEILRCVWGKNPCACVVVNAVSLETIAEVSRLLQRKDFIPGYILLGDASQLQVSRTRELGAYHLMQAENPVTIFRLRLQECGKEIS